MDTILFNGKIITGNIEQPSAEALAVSSGMIALVGDNEQVKAAGNSNTDLIDLEGRVVLPGFNDSHLHLLGYAESRSRVDLSNCNSPDEVLQAIRQFIHKNQVPEGEWVYGWGWNHSRFAEPEMPDRHLLDRASRRHCLAMVRTCCHILAANTLALEKAGIATHPPLIEGGTVETDSHGTATGILKEQAMQLILNLVPPLDKEKLKNLITLACRDFVAAGLTTVQTDDLSALGSDLLPVLLEAYSELVEENRLPVRINLQPLLMTEKELRHFIDQGYHRFNGSSFFKVGPLKLLADGSLGGKTAYLNEPYRTDPENCGMPVLNSEELRVLVNMAHREGMQVASHAIGDAAIEMVLKAYREANRLYPHPDPRFRIVHASIISPEALTLFKEVNALADIQPSFTATDHAYIDHALGAKRASWSYRWQDLYRSGIGMGGGSDCPVENYNPLDVLGRDIQPQ